MINEKTLENYENFVSSFITFINKDKYIGIKEYEKFIKEYETLFNELNHIEYQNDIIIKARRIFEDRDTLLKKHNSSFLKRKLIEYKEYFDNMFITVDKNILLDDNQRKAIIADEDNLLIVAGAGSGKTTTMAAKVKYLVEKQKVNPKEIAVISFTNKAADEIASRIHNDFGIKDIDVYTFHKLGMKIIRSSGKNIVSIIDDGGKYKLFSNYIKDIAFNDKTFFEKFNNAFNDKVYFDSEYKKFSTFKEYHDYSYNQKMINNKFNLETYIKSEIIKRRNFLKTINGEYVKSKQEVDIANFLYLNGIEYEYEKIYDKKLEDGKSYKPDFYIHQLDKYNYIEHFGVSEKYQNDRYTKKELENYLKNMKLKIEFHNSLDKLNYFITSYSSYNDGKSVIYHLKNKLLNLNYQFLPKDNKEIFKKLRDTSEDSYFGKFIDRILIPFISIFKQNGYTKDSFKILKEKYSNDIKEKLDILEKFYIYYEEELKRQNKVDFEDMINLAYNIIPTIKEEDLGIDYNYIIIDEYQDISFQRHNLTKKISDLFDAKIMAVGNDFQAIFGFTGSSIDLFVNFKNYLEGAKSIPIVNTYRNSQELVDLASDFVLKNKHQLKKYLNSNKHLKNPVEIVLYDDQKFRISDYTKPIAVSKIIEKIYAENPKKKILIM